MGGFGSGRWRSYAAKDTVESRKTFSVYDFRPAIKHVMTTGETWPGVIRWSRLGRETGSIGYSLTYAAGLDAPLLRLRYDVKSDGETVAHHDDWIEFAAVPCHFGGRRWLFRCPRCGRRCGRLCSHGAAFVCRLCANLTYQSVQEAHRYDSLYASLAADMGVPVSQVNAIMRALGPG